MSIARNLLFIPALAMMAAVGCTTLSDQDRASISRASSDAAAAKAEAATATEAANRAAAQAQAAADAANRAAAAAAAAAEKAERMFQRSQRKSSS